MNKIKLSILIKLIAVIVIFICFPFFIFGKIWYDQSVELIEQHAIELSSNNVQQMNNSLDSYFQSLKKLTLPITMHQRIQQFGELTPGEQYRRFEITREIKENVFPSLNIGRSDIQNTILLNSDYILTSNLGGLSSLTRYKSYYDQAIRENEPFGIQGVSFVNEVPVISVYRLFTDVRHFEPRGILVLDLNRTELLNLVNNLNQDSSFVWIMDAEQRYVYHPEVSLLGQAVDQSYLDGFAEQTKGYFIEKTKRSQTIRVFHRSELSGWTIVSEVPIRNIMSTLLRLRNNSMIIGILLIGCALIFVGGYSITIRRALLRLKVHMQQAEHGNLSARADENRNDEIGSLNRSFNKMVAEIQKQNEVIHKKQLIEKELQIQQRDSELSALQAQINPHFLYNSLEVINSHAILEGNHSVGRMARSLARLFRYNVQKNHPVVSLHDELQNIETYLSIQMERYPHLITDVQVNPDQFSKVIAPRLTLQPLIENAFKHGYENHMTPPNYIGIRGIKKDNVYGLQIIDHGKGMSEEMMNQLNKSFQENSPLSEMNSEGTQHVGMWNVHYRIVLHFGESYGIYILSSNQQGTVVEIRLPYEEDEK